MYRCGDIAYKGVEKWKTLFYYTELAILLKNQTIYIKTPIMIMVMVSIGILEIGAEESLAIFCNWFIVIVTLVLLALDILIVCTEYKATIALVGDYELAFKVQGKVEPVEVKFDLFAKKE